MMGALREAEEQIGVFGGGSVSFGAPSRAEKMHDRDARSVARGSERDARARLRGVQGIVRSSVRAQAPTVSKLGPPVKK